MNGKLCPSDFSASQIYMHFKDKEINATFVCHGCAKLESVSSGAMTGSSSREEGVFMFRHSKRMKLQRDQAKFMKLFEENDEPDDELGLDPVI
ncbi:hypothetical protein DY000_02000092 [Brassica cretica]|uniref:Uncharacterized protein n=1 Tax=Brassica cretica TaxID=69181 RepID=A0ABQ7BZP3_BRACR|nr:hypothetical protein DY000_02000092 [Brassica cretica]